jgi:hypothetical protein
MFCGGETERFKRFRAAKHLIAQRARKEPGQHGVVGLSNQDELITVVLNDHDAALFRSGASR